MKRILLLLAAFSVVFTASAQNYRVVKWEPPKQAIDSTKAMALANIQNQTGSLLYKAGKNLTWSVVWAGASAASSWIASDMANNNGTNDDSYKIMYGVSVGCAAAALICIISAASNLKEAGKLQQKIHPIPGGVSIDID